MIPGALLLFASLAGGFAGPDARPPASIPVVHGRALAGDAVDLPQQLGGRVGVLVIGFSQDAREEVAAWGRRLSTDYHGADAVRFYEVAMLGGVPRLLRGWVLGRIRDSVPDPARGQFLPIFDHEEEWKATVGFHKPGDAYVLVIDGTGVVRTRIKGAISDQQYAEVRRQIEALSKH